MMKISEGHYPSDTSLAIQASLWDEIDLIESWCAEHADHYYNEGLDYNEFEGNYFWIHIWFKTASDKTLFVLRFGS